MEQDELFSIHDYDSKRNINNKDDPCFNEKAGREIHRMMELLRFSPDENGVFIARCAPVYHVLPALGPYFTVRFGDTPWEIIDEKRGLSLSRKEGKTCLAAYSKEEQTKLVSSKEPINSGKPPDNGHFDKRPDEWEDLWKHYHKTINNESRDNPKLQRQLMPKRYWKYLPEKEESK